jgi:serine protease AprX
LELSVAEFQLERDTLLTLTFRFSALFCLFAKEEKVFSLFPRHPYKYDARLTTGFGLMPLWRELNVLSVSLTISALALLSVASPVRSQVAGCIPQQLKSVSTLRKVSPGLRSLLNRPLPEAKLPVIVQMDGASSGALYSSLKAHASQGIVPHATALGGHGVYKLMLTPAQVAALDANPHVRHLSHDQPIGACSDYTAQTVGADVAWNTNGLTGNGVVVAVVDSGIAPHPDLDGASRIVGWVDLVNGQTTPYDDFGHGTHVAGIIGGNGGVSIGYGFNPSLKKIAPHVQFVGVKVLDHNGQGSVSNVIAGINWCIANKSAYHIQVINLSLGTGVSESYTSDPLCQACEQAWQAGILVVVAAGNNGRAVPSDPNSAAVYGTINSPGNDPYVLTVGAMNTMGTAARADDKIASYSSRGPTIGDLIAKPDLVAPGNQIDSLSAPNATLYNSYPANIADPNYGAPAGSNSYFRLSGTSMATPVVAGAAALLLEADPTLTPDTIKARLMTTANFWDNGDPFSYGLGYLNIPAALASTAHATQAALSPSVTPNADGTVTFNNLIWGAVLSNLWCNRWYDLTVMSVYVCQLMAECL